MVLAAGTQVVVVIVIVAAVVTGTVVVIVAVLLVPRLTVCELPACVRIWDSRWVGGGWEGIRPLVLNV